MSKKSSYCIPDSSVNEQKLIIRNDDLKNLLITSLEEGASSSLRYNSNKELISDIAVQIAQSFVDDNNLYHDMRIIQNLIEYHDYRLVAEFVNARQRNKSVALNLFEQMIEANDSSEINKLHYQLAYVHFIDMVGCPAKVNATFVPCINDILLKSDHRILIYLINSSMKLPFIDLLDHVGIELGKFIEQQYDLPSLNALVRQGVVRIWNLPDGNKIVSKRDNPQKPGRFREEQLNYELIVSKMGGKPELYLGKSIDEKNIWLKIARPFAIISDGYSDCHYALTKFIEGISFEDLLMKESDQALRRMYLAHYRLILDALYDRGILWGDMSPRNIIFRQTKQDISYYLLDFEKTKVREDPISAENRKDHCRGQICAEEMCAICTLKEVQECFSGYFNTKDWDLGSEEIQFSKRPEVTDILQGRGINIVTLGEYNQTEYEMINVLTPYINLITKKQRYPSHLKFKVEHYLSCAGYDNARDYERKTTEVLIAAKRYNFFDDIVTHLTKITDKIEGAFLKAEFENLLNGNSKGYIISPIDAIISLIHTINELYESRHQKDNFLEFLSLLDP